jgi:hypothetical protein
MLIHVSTTACDPVSEDQFISAHPVSDRSIDSPSQAWSLSLLRIRPTFCFLRSHF